MSDLVVARNCCMARMFPREVGLVSESVGQNEQVCQGRKSVKCFERSNGLDTALYKKTTFLLCTETSSNAKVLENPISVTREKKVHRP